MITFHDTEIHTFGYDDRVVRKLLVTAEREGHAYATSLSQKIVSYRKDGVPPPAMLQRMMRKARIPEQGYPSMRPERPGYALEIGGIVWADIKRVLHEFPSLKTVYHDATQQLSYYAYTGKIRRRKAENEYHCLYAVADIEKLIRLHTNDEWQSTSQVRKATGREYIGTQRVNIWLHRCRDSGRVRYRKVGGRYLHHIEDVRNEMEKTLIRLDNEVAA